MDQCEIQSSRTGTEVVLKKLLARQAPLITTQRIGSIVRELAKMPAPSALHEIQEQNQALLRALAEVRERQDDLERLNRELEDTNRGVVALYAEIDEKADHLRRADEMKSRFLSNMSHEFRTPLHSIRALSRLLLERADGPLTTEQEKQVRFIVDAAKSLTELVDDLLDLAKIEAGKLEVRPVEFSVANLFSALRGMLRPLLVSEHVHLIFEDPDASLVLHSDEGKVSQILRNFIANALKFTERGEVRVSCREREDGTLTLAVSDTGIGIAVEDQGRIFDEFTQVHHRLQARAKGTGLGLPLCRKLAQLLGGQIALASEPGAGSTFSVTLPLTLAIDASADEPAGPEARDARPIPVLMVEDNPHTRFLYQKYLAGSPYRPVPASNMHEARAALRNERPGAILLDILLRGEETWRWLAELKRDPATSQIPVLVVTTVEDEAKGLALGADAYLIKPIDRGALRERLDRLVLQRVLVIDDDPAARYLVRKLLAQYPVHVSEAIDAKSGRELAKQLRPQLVLLDLQLPDGNGEQVLEDLRADPQTRAAGVVVLTASSLANTDRARIGRQADEIVHKSELDPSRLRDVLYRRGLEPLES
jgi:signal transduction histidine kinase/DNA-binding response OmpR family regulator